jgi:hypothetical protein
MVPISTIASAAPTPMAASGYSKRIIEFMVFP